MQRVKRVTGLLVVGADNVSHEGGGNKQAAEPQSGLWFGRTDDIWNLGKPKGWGGRGGTSR